LDRRGTAVDVEVTRGHRRMRQSPGVAPLTVVPSCSVTPPELVAAGRRTHCPVVRCPYRSGWRSIRWPSRTCRCTRWHAAGRTGAWQPGGFRSIARGGQAGGEPVRCY
jgi:hypothetical protein